MEQIRIAVLTPYDKVLAFLDNTVPSAMHYFDETLHTYLKGSAYTFEFTTMTAHDDAVFLVEGNRLSFTRKNKGYYLTIMNVEKGGNTTTVTAYGLCLELTNEYVDAYKAPRAMSFAEYVNAYGFEKSFVIGKNEVSDKRITYEWTGSDTVLARLYSIATVFDAELEFVTQLNDDYSLKNVVLNIYRAHSDSVQGMGSDKRSTILRYPNDVYGIIKTSDITELYTAIRPTGTNGLQLNSISGRIVKDANGNVLYKVNGNNILAPQARDRFPSTLLTNHSNDMYAVLVWSYETENVETLYSQALAQLKKNCVPKVTYDIDAYIDADIGDTFTIEDAEYSPTLYLEARITEQEICFTDSEKCKTIFDNFEEKQSQISSALISEMNKMIELKKVYEGSIVSSNGVLFKVDSDLTNLTALVKDDGVDITSKYSIIWYKDDERLSTSQTITVNASDFTEKAVYRFKAMSGEILKASAEVTVMRLQDGQNGTSAYVHIAYANSSDGRVDFSLTDSNRKFIGQYSDSKQYGSEDPTKYRWSVIKGEDGQSFISAEEQFYYSTSQTELVGGEWFVGNVVYQSDKFLWKRWKCTYANPSEIKYTKAIFDNTWNEIDSKIGEIHTQVSQANNQSKEAVDKATQAQTAASKANELANTANTQSSEAKQLAQDANTSTGKAQQQIDAIKGDITDSKQQIQDAVDKANANASEIATVKETYATKVDLTTESKTIHADVSTEIEKKVGELSTTVSQTYASKSDLTSIEGSLNTKIKQNADSITTQASSIEKLQSDTTQAQLDITEATKKATDAQTQASTALSNAQSAQTLADQAKQKADSAQSNLDNANKELADAKANLETVTGRVDATESEITKAQTRLTNAESAVQKAQSDATTAQGNAQTAINNAKEAQVVADDAKAKAEQAQKDLAELTNKVTSNTTAIEQNAKAIKLQATKITETSNKIDGIQNDITNNYYSKEQTDAQIKVSADKISQTVSETNKVVTSANKNATDALNKANSLTDRANSGEFDGRGVASTTVEYQASTSGTTVPTGAWSSTPPKTTADKPYLWTRTVITYSDSTQSTSYSVGSTPEGIQVGGRNLIKYGKGDSKNGIFKNFTRIEDGYAEFTLKSKKTYALVNIGEGFVLGCREYKVGAVYIWSYDIMFTEWNFPSGTNRNEFWFGQMYTNAPSGQTGTGQWTKVTSHNLPEVGSNGCKLNEWYHVEQKIIIPAQASANVGTAAFIQFYNSNANIEASFTARLKNVKLELGNKATDWTPAPEDVDEAINTERTERQSAIETKANEITSKVSETYVSNSAFEHYQNTVSTQFTQTKKDFTWSINQSVTDAKNEMSSQIDSVNGRLDGLKQTTDNVNSYMSFDNDALTLGKSDSAFKTKITNQEWSIQKNGAKVTYINDQTMYITDGQFTQSLKIGAFEFVPRANGSLDFKKVG